MLSTGLLSDFRPTRSLGSRDPSPSWRRQRSSACPFSVRLTESRERGTDSAKFPGQSTLLLLQQPDDSR